MSEKFKKQLKRDEEGWYETGLFWKEVDLPLGNNRNESCKKSKARFRNTCSRRYSNTKATTKQNNIRGFK